MDCCWLLGTFYCNHHDDVGTPHILVHCCYSDLMSNYRSKIHLLSILISILMSSSSSKQHCTLVQKLASKYLLFLFAGSGRIFQDERSLHKSWRTTNKKWEDLRNTRAQRRRGWKEQKCSAIFFGDNFSEGCPQTGQGQQLLPSDVVDTCPDIWIRHSGILPHQSLHQFCQLFGKRAAKWDSSSQWRFPRYYHL